MSQKFLSLVEQVGTLFDQLQRVEPVQIESFPRSKLKKGVYLFTDVMEGPMYVGRSNDIRRRWGLHCDPGSQHNQASFAFKRAREVTGKTKASYQSGPNSRKELVKNPKFRSAFDEAKRQIREMEFRFIEEDDQHKQYLLEFYAAITLETPYNDFETH